MISLPGNRYAIALNLERDSVGAVVMVCTLTLPKA